MRFDFSGFDFRILKSFLHFFCMINSLSSWKETVDVPSSDTRPPFMTLRISFQRVWPCKFLRYICFIVPNAKREIPNKSPERRFSQTQYQ